MDLSKRKIGMGKLNILEGFHGSMSLKKFPFTKATLCPQDVGAVEDTQVDISTAGHLPQTVTKLPPKNLCIAVRAGCFKILLLHIMEGYGVSVVLILIST